jgi:dsDNA-specific endonuclease/ATPase MutS2
MRGLAQVDLLSAKAQYAYQFDMTCPEITEKGPLNFSQARHPLLIQQALLAKGDAGGQSGPEAGERLRAGESQEVVPIDVRLGEDFDLLVITGSNTGGKTVALKTVALLVLMAQAGCHIPVRRGAAMPICRDVFIDVGDEQSLQQSLSTFGAHMKRIRYILRKTDGNGLVLLDELGAGTDPDEGGAIGQAVLDELLRIGCLGMVTTHLSVLKAYAMTHERVDNASVEFDTNTLSPTYHLRIGTPGESHAITVASKLGLGKRIVATARRHLDGQGRQFRKAILATGQARQVAEKARSDAQEAQMAAETEQEVYQAKLADLHRLQEDFEIWLASLSDWKAGDEIYVPSLGKTGRLVRLQLHKQIAVVDAENVQVEVPLRELMPDLGQSVVREQIASLREEILNQAKQAKDAQDEAQHMREEFQRSLAQQKQRAQQFDTWLGRIARVKVGDEVTIARKPGRGKLIKLDLARLKATVATDDGEMETSIQDLFPQTGPFAPRRAGTARGGARSGRRRAASSAPDRPMPRRRPDSQTAKANREAILAAQPGSEVYVVPFGKRATLIRLLPEKDLAVVQSGIFEMTIGLADLEPSRRKR